MKAHQAAKLWRELDAHFDFTVTARRIEAGPLQGQHVLEIEPRPALTTDQVVALSSIALERGLELSFGKSPRRVLVIA